MGAWKDWQIAMFDEGHSAVEVVEAAKRIQGTLADPLVRRLAAQADTETEESPDGPA